jgi:hypothetical protein
MAGTVVADTLQAASTSTLVLKNGVANTPPTIQDSAGTQIGTFCLAWVNFNGTTVTNPASMTGVRGSFNVSSILDNGTGDYTVNFTNALPDANYSLVATTEIVPTSSSTRSGYTFGIKFGTTPTASSVNLLSKTGSNTAANAAEIDTNYANVAVFR